MRYRLPSCRPAVPGSSTACSHQTVIVPRGCSLQSHRAPGHAGTDEQPVIVPNDEPSSQGYQESCTHLACAEDAIVLPLDYALKARWYELSIPCSLSIMRRSRRRRLTEPHPDVSSSGEHDLILYTVRCDPLVAVFSHTAPLNYG